MAAPSKVRLWLAESDDYREIDAVALLTAPFDTLDAPPPPPGAPEDGWVALEGEVLGAEKASFVHATLRTAEGGRAVNAGGPLRLRLGDGEEVEIGIGATAIFGTPVTRARGTWSDVADRVPWLARAFQDDPPAAEEQVSLEGRRIEGRVDATVFGDATQYRAPGGFRESAQPVPSHLVAAAICVGSPGDPSRERFEALGAGAFGHVARPLKVTQPAKLPLRAWTFGLAVTALVSTASSIVFSNFWGENGDLLGLALVSTALMTSVLALEYWAKLSFIPHFLRRPGAGFADRRSPFQKPFMAVVNVFIVGVGAGLAALPYVIACPDRRDLAAAAFVGAVYALIRLALWLRVAARPLLRAMKIVSAPSSRRFTGALATGDFVRKEHYSIQSKHLGKYTTTDSDGKTVTRDRYESWVERHINVQAPDRVRVVLADGRVAEASGAMWTTDVGLRPKVTHVADIARFESQHEEGDPATLVGEFVSPDTLEVKASHLVLGRLGELRRRVAVQLTALVGILLIIGLCAAVAWPL